NAWTELLVEPLDDVGGAQRLPLRLGEREERQQFGAAVLQAADHARAAFRPLAFEGGVRRAAGLAGGGVHDAMKVLAELVEGVLGRLALDVPEFVHAAPLHRRRRPQPAEAWRSPGLPS